MVCAHVRKGGDAGYHSHFSDIGDKKSLTFYNNLLYVKRQKQVETDILKLRSEERIRVNWGPAVWSERGLCAYEVLKLVVTKKETSV